ncbi:MAG: DUF938 domain-containing protein [Pseudomonadota bacterium]
MQSDLPFSQACENNKDAILAVLARVFGDRRNVLEIGSGTAQHAVHFARALTHLSWQPTELPVSLSVPASRIDRYEGDNLLPLQPLDVYTRPWSVAPADAVFSANSLHIMPFDAVESLFAELSVWSPADAVLAIYGPFNYGGAYTSESNAHFDQWLAARDARSAIRDFEAVDALAANAGFNLEEDNEMPANNRLLVWRRPAGS